MTDQPDTSHVTLILVGRTKRTLDAKKPRNVARQIRELLRTADTAQHPHGQHATLHVPVPGEAQPSVTCKRVGDDTAERLAELMGDDL